VGQLEGHFNQMAEQLVESMAQRQRLVEQNARQAERARIEQDMRTAQHIQQSLLPKEAPTLAGWRFTPYYKPAQEVGGDFYDFIQLDGDRLGIVIGDVSGKGVPAALVMAIARTMLRTASQTSTSPGEVLAQVNDLISTDLTQGMFVTCFYALLEPASGLLRYANAGHDLPYRCWRKGATALRATGMPLGLMPGSHYDEFAVTLEPDDTVLFYSDGLVEAHNAQSEMFSFPRLERLLREQSDPVSLIDVLLRELGSFTGAGWEQEDDVTLVTVQRTPAPFVPQAVNLGRGSDCHSEPAG
jgi:serine phosphatase RsbU (regulator of sigma subunit)